MRRLPFFLFLIAFACSACGGHEPKMNGTWRLDKFQNSYDIWEVHGNKIRVNENRMFARSGFMDGRDGDEKRITITEGLFAFDETEAKTGVVLLKAQKGTAPDRYVLRKIKTEEAFDFYNGVSVSFRLPDVAANARMEQNQCASFFLGPPDARKTQTLADYALQIGPHHHLGRMAEALSFIHFTRSHKSALERNQIVAALFIDAQMPMAQVYELTNELRKAGQYKVLYTTQKGHHHRLLSGIRRNLFRYTAAEALYDQNRKLDFDSVRRLPGVRKEFYDLLAKDDNALLRMVWIAEDQVYLDGALTDLTLLKQEVKNEVQDYENKKGSIAYGITATETTPYRQYLRTLATLSEAYRELRDEYFKTAFQPTYGAVVESDTPEMKRLQEQKYPEKIVEISPVVRQFRWPDL